MKKILSTSLMVASCAILNAQEITLDTSPNAMSGIEYRQMSENFSDIFIPGEQTGSQNGRFSETQYDVINYSNVQFLKTKVGIPPAGKQYVSMLRIVYGYKKTQNEQGEWVYNIKLIYLPDIAVRNTLGASRLVFQKQLTANPKVYMYNPATQNFDESNYNDSALTFINNYREAGAVMINAYGVPNLPYSQLSPLTFGDAVQSISYPFQELKDFFETAGGNIYVSNIAKSDPATMSYKHIIAFSPRPPAGYTPDNYDMKVADLGALCPIRCYDILLVPTMSGGHTIGLLK